MMNSEISTDPDTLIQSAITKRGYKTLWHDYMAEHDLDYLRAYESIYTNVMTQGKHLDLKARELIVVAALAVQREDYGLDDHIRRAMRLGATDGEIVETFQSAAFHTGALTLVHGMKVFLEIKKEQAQAK